MEIYVLFDDQQTVFFFKEINTFSRVIIDIITSLHSIVMMKIAWDLDECSFMLVAL